MNKTTKALLILAIVGLVAGFALNTGLVNPRDIDAFYVVFPMGAVFAGLFLISKLLEKETARYDEELRTSEEHHESRTTLGTH